MVDPVPPPPAGQPLHGHVPGQGGQEGDPRHDLPKAAQQTRLHHAAVSLVTDPRPEHSDRDGLKESVMYQGSHSEDQNGGFSVTETGPLQNRC